MPTSPLRAGAAESDITPRTSQFLYGYPHVERMSTGTHDPLRSSAVYLNDGDTRLLLIANDIIWVPRPTAHAARRRIADATGVPFENILISGSHTHSAPHVGTSLITDDPVVPQPDPAYNQQLEDGIVDAATRAAASARDAEVGLTLADVTGIGTNRHDPSGPSMLEAPVLAVRDAADHKTFIAVMTVCNMHPTVMHEDSTLVSGDFPGLARQHLQKTIVGEHCPLVYHMGTAGNQSPRHVTRSNTFDEAQRLGEILSGAIADALERIDYTRDAPLACDRAMVELELRHLPPVDQADTELKQAIERLESLRTSGAPRTEVRTAECDWFGAEKTLTLARALADGRLQRVRDELMPAEIMVMRIGPWKFVGWPGEAFVEFGQQVRHADPDAFVITTVNGGLHGYLVTQQAIDNRWYEAGNAIFQSPESPQRFVDATLALLEKHEHDPSLRRKDLAADQAGDRR